MRLEVEFKEFGNDIAEFIAVGTAVKADEPATVATGATTGQPFTSDLSGQDFWTLLQAGYVPLGMVMGTCVYHVAHRALGNVLCNVGQNIELPQFTQALYDARELAMSRMQARGRGAARGGHRRGAAAAAQPHLGRAHHGVLRDRHGGPAAAARTT